jgi:hypothetical protein
MDLMEMDTYLRLFWSLAAAALALGGAAVVLAYRRAERSVWLTHGVLSVGVAVALTMLVQRLIGEFVPWWRTGVGYLVIVSVPLLAAGWVGRWTARRWPAGPRWHASAAVVVALVVFALLNTRVGPMALPQFDMVNAVQ